VSPAGLRAADCFRSSRFLYGYARGKIRWDPAYPTVANILRSSKHPILDIGCGIGLLAAYLREEGLPQPILGIEPDAAKVASARESVTTRYSGLTFNTGDARDLPDFCGDLILLDILHYMQPDEQQMVLGSVADHIAPGGCALIRTTFRDHSWRYHATMLEEIVVRATGWIRGGRCHFPTRHEVESAFPASRFAVSTRPLWGRTPFNSHLVEIRREA